MNRRELLFQTAPACALVSFGLQKPAEVLAFGTQDSGQDAHKFDEVRDAKLSPRAVTRMQYSQFFSFIQNMQAAIGEPELIKLLNIHSTAVGKAQGEQQAETFADTEFQTFVAQFRPPNYAGSLTHEVVEDTENVFELRVTECLWASVFRDAGLDGEIGHAAVCNMDYGWPAAFSSKIKMEREHTLMQRHAYCNHRYLKIT